MSDFLEDLQKEYGSYVGPDYKKHKTLITRKDWEFLKKNYPLLAPEGSNPEDAGFMLYYSAEQLDLLMRLKERWEVS